MAWWRQAHWRFFSLECEELGIEPTEDMLLVLERLKVVFLNNTKRQSITRSDHRVVMALSKIRASSENSHTG